MIDSEFCMKCGRPYAMYGIWYCDSCIKDMLYEKKTLRKNSIIEIGQSWDTEKADPIADIKKAIEAVKTDVGYRPMHPILEKQQKQVEASIIKCIKELLDNKRQKGNNYEHF